MAWPVGPPNPSYYSHIGWFKNAGGFGVTPDPRVRPYGVHFPGDTVYIPFIQATTATSYKVFDYYGNVVVTGTFGGNPTTLAITEPTGGWKLGWYRIYFAGSQTDPVWGDTYASSQFCFVNTDSNLFPVPPGDYSGMADPFQPSDGTTAFSIKAAMGNGTSRLEISDLTNLHGGTDGENLDNAVNYITDTTWGKYGANCWTAPTLGSVDPARPRYLWMSFPNGSVDRLAFPASWGSAFCKDGTVAPNGDKVFVASSGSTITVYYPNSSTLVETWNGCTTGAAAQTVINGNSNYIVVSSSSGTSPGTLAATAIGNTYWNGVGTVVSTLYPLGITYYEGPYNEPSLTSYGDAQQTKLFAAAVHAGNASAKALGPSHVDIGTTGSLTSSWKVFFDNGGASLLDGIAAHAYNSQVNGDFNLGRRSLTDYMGVVKRYGYDTLPHWQTESTWSQPAVFGVFHPRRTRTQFAMQLLWEQFGVPRERNNSWYDVEHGFWSVPAMWCMVAMFPQGALARTLALETWGKNHTRKLSFGELADNLFFGSIYGNPDSDRVAVLMANSWMPTSTITFNVSGASTLTVVDCWGNTSTVNVTAGQATINVAPEPTYVRIPPEANIEPVSVNDWPVGRMKNLCGSAATLTVGPTSALSIGANQFLSDYVAFTNNTTTGGMVRSTNSLPDTVVVTWGSNITTDRVIVWAGPTWQKASTLLTFTVDTSTDGGTTWTTRATVDNSANATSVLHGSAHSDTACTRETWFNDQYIFDVPLGGSFTCNAVRLNVTAATYGGEPDSASATVNSSWGASDSAPHIVIQNLAVVDADHTYPTRQARTFNGSSHQIAFGPNPSIFSSTGKATIGAWVKIPSTTAAREVAVCAGNGTNGINLGLTSTGALSLEKASTAGGQNFVTSTLTVGTSTWTYIAAVIDTNASTNHFFKMLENGTYSTNDQTNNSTFVSTGNITIGNVSGGTSWFNGEICDVAIWYDQKLSDSELQYAALNGADSIGKSPDFYARLDGEPLEKDKSTFYQTGVLTGTTLTAGLPSVTSAKLRSVGSNMILGAV